MSEIMQLSLAGLCYACKSPGKLKQFYTAYSGIIIL